MQTRITPAQCRAARALLDWSIKMAANQAGISMNTIGHFERGNGMMTDGNKRHLVAALTAAGIVFIPNGVILSPEPNQPD